jgi:DNA ligase D-like protein (predicted 3'-phosphoesterase)
VGLKEYLKKRNLKKSGEPSAYARNNPESKLKKSERGQEQEAVVKKSGTRIYVVQEHHASHLHWDLRLEFDGVLKSWAIPKVPPKKKGIKRLAISVEDHPINYAKFEGEIKEGYGKGFVKIWDKGNYKLIEKNVGKIEFEIFGKQLRGKYVLVKTNYGSKPEKSWLFFKI